MMTILGLPLIVLFVVAYAVVAVLMIVLAIPFLAIMVLQRAFINIIEDGRISRLRGEGVI